VDPLLCGVLLAEGSRQAPQSAPSSLNALPSGLEELIARLSRRAAWGGDGARATARLELAAGELSGAVVTVHTERREVRVEIDLPPDARASGLAERISERLAQRGFAVTEVLVS
jgi:hypothetical protein